MSELNTTRNIKAEVDFFEQKRRQSCNKQIQDSIRFTKTFSKEKILEFIQEKMKSVKYKCSNKFMEVPDKHGSTYIEIGPDKNLAPYVLRDVNKQVSEFIDKESKTWNISDYDVHDIVATGIKKIKDNDTIKSIEEKVIENSDKLLDRMIKDKYDSLIREKIEKVLKYEDNLFSKQLY